MELDCRIKIVVISDTATYPSNYLEKYVEYPTQDLLIETIGAEFPFRIETYRGNNIFWNIWVVLFNNHFNEVAEIFFSQSNYFLILSEKQDIHVSTLLKIIIDAHEGSGNKFISKPIKIVVASPFYSKNTTHIDQDTGLVFTKMPICNDIFIQFLDQIKLSGDELRN